MNTQSEPVQLTLAERLRNYATAMADPTRASILSELDRVSELTATQIAHRLGHTANNLYHHMRVLLQLGIVDPPRSVPGSTYVEKYYHLNRDVSAAIRLDPTWYQQIEPTLTTEARQAMVVSICLTSAHLLRQAANDYAAMDPADLDRLVREQRVFSLAVNRISREDLVARQKALFEAFEHARSVEAENTQPRTDLMIVAALPGVVREEG